MLMCDVLGLFWTCDLCRKPGVPGKDLGWAWRLAGQRRYQCYVVHEDCLADLAAARLIEDDELYSTDKPAMDITVMFTLDWDFRIGTTETQMKTVTAKVLTLPWPPSERGDRTH